MDRNAESRLEVEKFYDTLGDWEWLRLDHDFVGRAAWEMHRRFLARHVPRASRVLEIGAGPGRFTIELARMDCQIVVSDLSAVQLRYNEEHVRAAGLESRVERRVQLDVCDLSTLKDGEFDAVVAYGGPLSYVWHQETHALRECFRVTRSGGVTLASVMSRAGSGRAFLNSFRRTIEAVGLHSFSQFLEHGDQRAIADAPGVHPCQLFTWTQVQELVAAAGGKVVDASASNWLSLGSPEAVEDLAAEAETWSAFLDWEEQMCAEAGAIDGGTHILFAARRGQNP